MSGESPGGGVVHIGGGECVEAQLAGLAVDILSNSLQTCEVLDLVHGVTRLLDEGGVDDDAVALIAVADGNELAVLIIEVVSVGIEFLRDRGVLQIKSEIAPVLDALLVADDKQSGSLGLVHLSGKGGAVGAGSRGNDLDLYALRLGVLLREILQGLVELRLEVQPVNGAALGGLGVGLAGFGSVLLLVAAVAAGYESKNHHCCQQQC